MRKNELQPMPYTEVRPHADNAYKASIQQCL